MRLTADLFANDGRSLLAGFDIPASAIPAARRARSRDDYLLALLQTELHLSSALSQAVLSASFLAALKHAAWDTEQLFMQAARGLIFAFGWGNSNAHVSSKRANPSFI